MPSCLKTVLKRIIFGLFKKIVVVTWMTGIFDNVLKHELHTMAIVISDDLVLCAHLLRFLRLFRYGNRLWAIDGLYDA